ncbi:MAG: hypothetical protein LBD88_01915 [Candidatus Peribacteria bacterium]|jgi:hypothetical protein|nr:hypothetical protein [Candidatus Peribacteria bacterium]
MRNLLYNFSKHMKEQPPDTPDIPNTLGTSGTSDVTGTSSNVTNILNLNTLVFNNNDGSRGILNNLLETLDHITINWTSRGDYEGKN